MEPGATEALLPLANHRELQGLGAEGFRVWGHAFRSQALTLWLSGLIS